MAANTKHRGGGEAVKQRKEGVFNAGGSAREDTRNGPRSWNSNRIGGSRLYGRRAITTFPARACYLHVLHRPPNIIFVLVNFRTTKNSIYASRSRSAYLCQAAPDPSYITIALHRSEYCRAYITDYLNRVLASARRTDISALLLHMHFTIWVSYDCRYSGSFLVISPTRHRARA